MSTHGSYFFVAEFSLFSSSSFFFTQKIFLASLESFNVKKLFNRKEINCDLIPHCYFPLRQWIRLEKESVIERKGEWRAWCFPWLFVNLNFTANLLLQLTLHHGHSFGQALSHLRQEKLEQRPLRALYSRFLWMFIFFLAPKIAGLRKGTLLHFIKNGALGGLMVMTLAHNARD